jgi:hypothetical protein
MSTEQLLLAAVGSPDTWTLTAGSTKVAACQTPDDDATSYITSPTANNSEQRFSLDDPTLIGSGDTINSVQVRIRHQRAGAPAGTIQAFLVLSTNVSYGTSTATGASWADLTENIAKPGGGTWTLTDLNNLVVGVRNTTNGRAVFCTTIEVIADYNPGDRTVNVSDGVTVADTPTVELQAAEDNDLVVDVSDEATLGDNATAHLSDADIAVSESVTIADRHDCPARDSST